MSRSAARIDEAWPRTAVVLGVNEIASAVAVHLCRAGWRPVLSHDPFPPVIRRGMAFHDALFGEPVAIEGIAAALAPTAAALLDGLAEPGRVTVTPLHLMDLLPEGPFDVLVDGRMQKHRMTPDLRGLARITIGLGPQFFAGRNCDVAVETHPARAGAVVETGATEDADGTPRPLGEAGRERFVYSRRAGRWRGVANIGQAVSRTELVGWIDDLPVQAPIDGIVRGAPRDGTLVPSEVKVVEMDPRGRDACWTGIDPRGRAIAEGAVRALQLARARTAGPGRRLGSPPPVGAAAAAR